MSGFTNKPVPEEPPLPLCSSSAKWLILPLGIVLALLLGYHIYGHYRGFRDYERELAARAVEGAAAEVNHLLVDTEHSLRLFVMEHLTLVSRLARDMGEDSVPYRCIKQALGSWYPDLFAFTVTDQEGTPLLEDFDGLVGPSCKADISTFAHDPSVHKVAIHPMPGGYHFDIMVSWADRAGRQGVFFVSFRPRVLSRMLANFRLPGHRLLLTRNDREGLIEVSGEGVREVFSRPLSLTTEEQRAVETSVAIPGSRWQVVALPETAFYTDYLRGLLLKAGSVAVVVLMVAVFFAARMAKEAKRRCGAERELALNARVDQMVADISANLVGVGPHGLDRVFRETLGAVGEFARADRGFLLVFDREGTTIEREYQWCSQSGPCPGRQLEGQPLEGWSAMDELFDQSRLVDAPRVADLSEEQRQAIGRWLRPDCRALAAAPLVAGSGSFGVMGLAGSSERDRWPSEGLRLLQRVAAVFATALERLGQQDALDLSHRRLLAVLDSLDATVYVADMDSSEILFVNRRLRDTLGNVEGKTCWRELHEQQKGPCDHCTNDRLLQPDGSPGEPIVWDYHDELEGRWYHIHDKAVRWVDGRVVHLQIALDITARKDAEARAEYLAYYDPLTELPNRRLMLDHLHQALARSRRTELLGALLHLDLDNFKHLNDALGHPAGDELLRQTSRRLLDLLRDEDTVARIGGDEFVILLEGLGSYPDAAARMAFVVADRVRSRIAEFYRLDGQEQHLSCSIGITLFPREDDDANEIVKQAETALHSSKQEGHNTICYFQPSMQAAADTRLALEKDLRCAIRDRGFHLAYQPQVDEAGHLVGAEALLRWTRSSRESVSPEVFIPLAEETGLILDIGKWVLEEACGQLARWSGQGDGLDLDHLSVNVSPRQFRQYDFVGGVRELVEQSGVDPRRLVLELTEGMIVADIEDTVAKMQQIKDLGVKVSIDDFGTGYSSLAYLTRLPIDQIKIDRSFVNNIPTDPNDSVIVDTIIAMASHLHIDIVAEGVETRAQMDYLRGSGCTVFQGFLFHRPLAVEEFERVFVRQSDSTAEGSVVG